MADVIRFPGAALPTDKIEWVQAWLDFWTAINTLPPEVHYAGVRCGILPAFAVAMRLKDDNLARDFHCVDILTSQEDRNDDLGGAA